MNQRMQSRLRIRHWIRWRETIHRMNWTIHPMNLTIHHWIPMNRDWRTSPQRNRQNNSERDDDDKAGLTGFEREFVEPP